jgi:coniferyl-aldehyde dehydrogenase
MKTNIERLSEVFEEQKQANLAEPYPALDTRIERIQTLRRMLVDNRELFHASVAADFGSHSPLLVDMMETGPVIARTSYFEEHLESWMQPQEIELGTAHGSSHGKIIRVPKGITGNIAPWNFPIESALVMCTDMLAAGNRVIIKPSELAPNTAEAIEQVAAQYFDSNVLTVIQGDAEFGQAFSSMQWDHLTFTGSSRVGRLVMQAAAKNLVPVTLELGGKNPTIFAQDGITEELIGRFLSFKNLKSGQVCTSPDHVFVHEEQLEEWIKISQDFWQKAYPAHLGHPDTTGIINDSHYQRIVGYIQQATERGVRVIGLNNEVADSVSRQVPMTLIVNPSEDLGCMNEEVFGPVIPVITYKSIDDVFEKINQGPSPLGSYLVTHDDKLAEKFVKEVRSGGAAINNFGIQGGHVALPFGGVGMSGQGCHSGYEGFLNYSHTKSLFYGASDSPVHAALMPPIHK